MAIPAGEERSYLARQAGSLALAQVAASDPLAWVRAASRHNLLLGAGLQLPLYLVHDLGSLLTAPRAGGLPIGAPRALLERAGVPEERVTAYGALLRLVADSDVAARAASWRISDELLVAVLLRLLGDVRRGFADPALGAGAEPLPTDPSLWSDIDVGAAFRGFDPRPSLAFLDHVASHAWHLYAGVEQIDLDTLRLLGLFGGAGGGATALPDLAGVFDSPGANDMVNFSLELLPSVLETKRAQGAQSFSMDGYAALERRGSVDSLVLSEFAYDGPLFEQKLCENELLYYAHERQHDEARRLHYLLIDASASMRGRREVFGRGLAIAQAKKIALLGDEAWLRFFDSRLYDIVSVGSKGAGAAIPYVLTFRSERGRNYARVFRQLALELGRLRRRRQVTLTIVTHGECHIPGDIVRALREHAALAAVIILPSAQVTLDWLPLCNDRQIVDAAALASRESRRDRALDILKGTGQEARAAAPARPRGERA